MATNLAAWSPSPKGHLEVKEAPMHSIQEDEILIKVRPLGSYSTLWHALISHYAERGNSDPATRCINPP